MINTGAELATIRAAYAKVDAYQPVYKFETSFQARPISRACVDRCEFLEKRIGPEIRNIRILDVGCSMGYLSLFLAERGATVTGIDYNAHNVEFCKALSNTLKIPAHFHQDSFSTAFCDNLDEGQFDVVFLFSVLHHVVNDYGVEATRSMMANLLSKVDALYVELAQKSENVTFKWKDALPQNDLDIFSNINGIEIEKLGEFPALGETTIRPMYRITTKIKKFNNISHRDLEIRRSDIKDGRTKDRKYFLTNELFTKSFIFSETSPGTYHRFTAETTTYQRIGRHPNFLPLLGTEIRGRLGLITVPRVRGPSLMKSIQEQHISDLRSVALSAISILRAFSNASLFWNDFRSHNLIVEDGKLLAIDFEASSPIETENTLNILLWLLVDLQSRRLETQNSGALEKARMAGSLLKVERPPYGLTNYDETFQDIVQAAMRAKDIREFLKIY